MSRTTYFVAALASIAASLAVAQTLPKALPLDNLGLEHLDIVVPDTAAAARFYARIFKGPLHEPDVVRFTDNNGITLEVRVVK